MGPVTNPYPSARVAGLPIVTCHSSQVVTWRINGLNTTSKTLENELEHSFPRVSTPMTDDLSTTTPPPLPFPRLQREEGGTPPVPPISTPGLDDLSSLLVHLDFHIRRKGDTFSPLVHPDFGTRRKGDTSSPLIHPDFDARDDPPSTFVHPDFSARRRDDPSSTFVHPNFSTRRRSDPSFTPISTLKCLLRK